MRGGVMGPGCSGVARMTRAQGAVVHVVLAASRQQRRRRVVQHSPRLQKQKPPKQLPFRPALPNIQSEQLSTLTCKRNQNELEFLRYFTQMKDSLIMDRC